MDRIIRLEAENANQNDKIVNLELKNKNYETKMEQLEAKIFDLSMLNRDNIPKAGLLEREKRPVRILPYHMLNK